MSESFLSSIWYRVGHLRPRLRAHVKVSRHRYRGQAWYVLHDLASGRTHRFTPAAYLFIGQLDGGQSVDEVWQQLAQTHDTHAPGQDDVVQLLSKLHQADLIQYSGSPDVSDLLERHGKQSRQLLKQNLTNPMSFRARLWDPDPFLRRTLPYLRPLLGRAGLAMWGVVVVLGLITAALNWQALTNDLSTQLLTAQSLLISAVTYPLLKALHEFAHAYLIRKWGGEVREMGLMFLVFFPVPYVEGSAASAFRSKYARAAVAAGGIFVETFVAALAIMVWAAAEPGMVRAIAFNLAMIGGLSTLLINGNPLLKFDAYYVLSDLIEIPNLATRATKWWGYRVQRHIFGARNIKADPATKGEEIWFALYAPTAWIYRMLMVFGIAIFIASEYFILGVALACWSIFSGMIKPLAKNLRHVLTSPGLRKMRKRAVGWTFGSLALALLILFLLPLPLRTYTQGVIWLPDAATLRAGTGGFLTEMPLDRGVPVQTGQALARLSAPTLSARIEVLRARVAEAQQRLILAETRDRSALEAARISLAQSQAELARESLRLSRLSLTAPLSGTFEPVAAPQDLAGRYFAEGDVVAHVIPPMAETARVVVSQDDIALVRDRYRAAEVTLAGWTEQVHPAQLGRAVPQASLQLPAPALGSAGGGPILVDPSDRDGVRALEQVFLFDLTLPPALQGAPFGTRVFVRFDHGFEPAGQQIWRRLRQLFLRQFNA